MVCVSEETSRSVSEWNRMTREVECRKYKAVRKNLKDDAGKAGT
jgi:hypothetical protein